MRQYSLITRNLLGEFEMLVAGKQKCCSKSKDIVHGDLTLSNTLIHNDQVTEVVDWDAAGCGDRAFDLTVLLYSTYKDVSARQQLTNRILQITSFEIFQVYMTYAMLAQLDWSIRHHSQKV